MSKTKISDYSSTPADNTDIGGINIAEGMLPSDVNNAIREQMAQLKNFQSGTSGESVTFATVNATTISASNINKVTVTAPATGSTLTIADGKTLTANNSLTLAGTDATTMTFPSTSATIARTDAAQTFTGTQTFSSALVLPAGTVSAPSFAPTGDTNTGIFFPAADTIALATNGVERAKVGNSETVFNDGGANVDFRVEGDTDANLLFVDASTDRVGIGTSSPDAKLQVNAATTTLKTYGSSFNSQIHDSVAGAFSQASWRVDGVSKALVGANSTDMLVNTAGDASANIIFATGSGTTERARFTSDGYLRMASGSGGIQFNGDTAAANALDDYEEGTFTPTLGGTWTSNPTSLTGRYTKIGEVVCIWVTWLGGTKASAVSGHIAGMPFGVSSAAMSSVSDVDVTNRGLALLDQGSRIFLTNTSFSAFTNYTSFVYRT
jgi:hypothetical protein